MLVLPCAAYALTRNSWVQKRCLKACLGCIFAFWSLKCCSPLISSQLALLRYLDADAHSQRQAAQPGAFPEVDCPASPPGA